MSSRQTIKYRPRDPSTPVPYLRLVPTSPSQGVGLEAANVAVQMEELAIRIAEALTRTLLPNLGQDLSPIPYKHVSTNPVSTVKVRFRNLGRLMPREIPLDDE
jgi:hypothetical protein